MTIGEIYDKLAALDFAEKTLRFLQRAPERLLACEPGATKSPAEIELEDKIKKLREERITV